LAAAWCPRDPAAASLLPGSCFGQFQLFLHIACTLCEWRSRGGEGVAEFLRMQLQKNSINIQRTDPRIIAVENGELAARGITVGPSFRRAISGAPHDTVCPDLF